MTAVLVASTSLGAGYAVSHAALPQQRGNDQSSIIFFSDGRTEIARLGMENRTEVKLARVPEHVQRAVLAAENRDFYNDSGISPGGIARAAWADASGKPVQGGSTITQQYVKNVYLGPERSLQRKRREIVLAIKLNRKYSKAQILEWYLNTIYFGRGAYGIEAAAETYFGVPVGRITIEQAAVLAASIRSPSGYDPQEHPQLARDRWQYVLRGMVSQRWLTASHAGTATYPPVRRIGSNGFNNLTGPNGYIVWRVEQELATHGITGDLLRRGGLRIVTTIDRQAQGAAAAAVARVFAGQPADLRQALVAVEPGSGRVRAYYGGKLGYGAWDQATHSYPPGPAIEPYVLAGALSSGVSLWSRWDGSSPRRFGGRAAAVGSSGDSQGERCTDCDLMKATALAVNPVFYQLTAKLGAANAARQAAAAGIRTLAGRPIQPLIAAGRLGNGFGIGESTITPLDQADGLATFAAGGVHHDPYFVERVVRIATGGRVYEHRHDAGRRAFSAGVAEQVTMAMQGVLVRRGGGPYDRSLDGGRPAAAVLGTAQSAPGPKGTGSSNTAAWMCGFTLELAVAVWVGPDRRALVDKAGRQIYAIGLPALTWRAFMNGALRGRPIQPLTEGPLIIGPMSKDRLRLVLAAFPGPVTVRASRPPLTPRPQAVPRR